MQSQGKQTIGMAFSFTIQGCTQNTSVWQETKKTEEEQKCFLNPYLQFQLPVLLKSYIATKVLSPEYFRFEPILTIRELSIITNPKICSAKIENLTNFPQNNAEHR